MTRSIAITLPAFLFLAACGGGGSSTPAENAADQLENAADQSDPAAADVLDDAADTIEGSNAGSAEANAIAQDALNQAGNAQ